MMDLKIKIPRRRQFYALFSILMLLLLFRYALLVHFPSIVFVAVLAMIACVSVCLAFMGVQNVSWLNSIGRQSLVIVLMHKFPVVFFQVFGPFKLLLQNPNSLRSFLLGGIPVTVVASALCVMAGWVIEKVCPILIASPSQRRKWRKAATRD